MRYILFTFFLLFLAPEVDAAWFNSNYQYCREMTMSNSHIATTTTNGFALVYDSDIHGLISDLKATSSGGKIEVLGTHTFTTVPFDLVVTDGTECNSDGGALLDFYIERYDQTTASSTVWLESNDVSSTTDKTVLFYYGNSSATDQSDEAGVFGALGEEAVWDLSEDPSGSAPQILDSTSNNNDGTSNGSMTTSDQVAGQVDGSVDFDGSNDYISICSGCIDTSGAITALIWSKVNTSDVQNSTLLGGSGNHPTFDRLSVHAPWSDNNLYWDYGDANGAGRVSTSYSSYLDKWTHVGLVSEGIGGSFQGIYLDGSLATSKASSDGPSGSVSFNIGTVFGFYHKGTIDDVRIYNRALSDAGILTIYNNTSSSTFWMIGAEEEPSAAPVEPDRDRKLLISSVADLPKVRLWDREGVNN